MPPSRERTRRLEVMPDRWIMEDAKTFRLLAAHPPPRPYGYLDQLKEDARSWKLWTLWIVGAGLMGLAGATSSWLLLPVGVGVLACWFWLCWRTVRHFRQAPILWGRIEARQRHPLLADSATAQARLEDGQEIPVTFVRRLAAEILADVGRMGGYEVRPAPFAPGMAPPDLHPGPGR